MTILATAASRWSSRTAKLRQMTFPGQALRELVELPLSALFTTIGRSKPLVVQYSKMVQTVWFITIIKNRQCLTTIQL